MYNTKRILLICLDSLNNVGEDLLGCTTQYLINSIAPNIKITRIQLMPTWKDVYGANKISWLLGTILRKFSRLIPFPTLSYKIRNIAFILTNKNYYLPQIKNSDKVILSIGMLKYSTQNFSYVFYLIAKICTEYNKPVLFSAMSPEMANKSDWRYAQLVEAVNMPSIQMLTTRDGITGMDIIRSDYIRKNIYCDYVGDPALWIPETYGVKKHKKAPSTTTPHVGINVIRKGIFRDYNKSFTDKGLINIYIALIQLIQKKGWQWTLFCNGMKEDWRVIQKLKQKMNIPNNHIQPIPHSGQEYVNMVGQFDAIFGARLHCCITSVALDIPIVGFYWDNKLKFFSKTMEIDQFFFHPAKMSAENIIDSMEKALLFHFNTENINFYKQKTRDAINKFILS